MKKVFGLFIVTGLLVIGFSTPVWANDTVLLSNDATETQQSTSDQDDMGLTPMDDTVVYAQRDYPNPNPELISSSFHGKRLIYRASLR